MIKQMKYFQAVVRSQSFTKAAEECFISQSAISQQIQALERELGVTLMQRERRSFKLTPAGELFYRKSLVLVSDFERLCQETIRLAGGVQQRLTIGYLKHYRGYELKQAIPEFHEKFPEIAVKLKAGTHEELYEYLKKGKADIVISDLRRVPSEQYVNFYLTRGYFYIEIASHNPMAQMDFVDMDDLKNTPCIIIAPKHQELSEENFYREYLGVKSDFLFAESLEEAHLLAVTGQGYFPVEFNQPPEQSEGMPCLPLLKQDKQLYRDYYAFWRAEALKEYIEDFATLLKSHFPQEAKPAKVTEE